MRNPRLLVTAAALVLAAAAPLWSREFSKPYEAVNPLAGVAPDAPFLIPASYADIGYRSHLISRTDYDLFVSHTLGAFTFLHREGRWALGGIYSAYLLSGPIPEEDEPPSIMAWYMNSVQFEYGFHAAVSAGPVDLLFEYSRYSYHPLDGRRGEGLHAIRSSEFLRAGVALPPVRLRGLDAGHGPLEIKGYARTGYVDLYDFWNAGLKKPREVWRNTVSARGELPLGERLAAYSWLNPDLLVLRQGGVDLDLYVELGISIQGAGGSADFFLDYYRSGDTFELWDGPHPVNLAGFGLRLKTR